MTKKFKWIVEIEVDVLWVADGFNLDNDRASEMVRKELPYAYTSEVTAKVLKAPHVADIMKVQGYDNASIKQEQALHA